MITFRPGPSFISLYKAMERQEKFDNMECFLQYLKEECNEENHTITFSYYSEGDERIGWSNIFLVIIENIPYGFVTFDEVKDGTMFNSKGEKHNE